MYEWNGREQELYRLYVEERKPLDEVMEYMRNTHGFTPSKRAYQTQFKRWEFPSKQNPAHKNAPLVERTRQLWEANTSQKDMLRILKDEGFVIKERELMRVRAKNRWLLRMPNGVRTHSSQTTKSPPAEVALNDNDGEVEINNVESQIQDLIMAETNGNADDQVSHEPQEESSLDGPLPLTSELSPEVRQKRAQRFEKLQAESADRYATKKRRRRTRGWAGLPADPPAPPRFPSETTLDESKAYLHMDNTIYHEVREQFMNICQEAGFIKKTLAGPERWEEAKNKLITENTHLGRQFNGPFDGVPLESKKLALDVVCTDVTKRMRTLERRMTIAEAKNVLGVNPEQSRQIRNHFYDVLKSDHFTSKLQAGEEHWRELKQLWIAKSPMLQEILEPSDANNPGEQVFAEKHRAAEVLCRDVMKRFRDEQTKMDPSHKKQSNQGPGPGPAPPRVISSNAFGHAVYSSDTFHGSPTRPQARRAPQATMSSHNSNNETSDLQIDPTLLAAAANSTPTGQETPANFDQLRDFAVSASASEQHMQAATNGQQPSEDFGPLPTPANPIPALLRLSDESQTQLYSGNKFWAGIITSTSLENLTQVIQRKYRDARILRIDAVWTSNVAESESLVTLDSDEAVSDYFERGAKGNAVFSIVLG